MLKQFRLIGLGVFDTHFKDVLKSVEDATLSYVISKILGRWKPSLSAFAQKEFSELWKSRRGESRVFPRWRPIPFSFPGDLILHSCLEKMGAEGGCPLSLQDKGGVASTLHAPHFAFGGHHPNVFARLNIPHIHKRVPLPKDKGSGIKVARWFLKARMIPWNIWRVPRVGGWSLPGLDSDS